MADENIKTEKETYPGGELREDCNKPEDTIQMKGAIKAGLQLTR